MVPKGCCLSHGSNHESEPAMKREYDPPLDPGIAPMVELLWEHGVETYESCQGGSGHAFLEPSVRFEGGRAAGFKALAVAIDHGQPVNELRRVWSMIDGEPDGPFWELTFVGGV